MTRMHHAFAAIPPPQRRGPRLSDRIRDPDFANLATLQTVIEAFDAVIKSGAPDPDIEHDAWIDEFLAKVKKKSS